MNSLKERQESARRALTEVNATGPVMPDGRKPAPVPVHFIREGTGRHWFWNATTTYQLLAWDEGTIAQSVDRLARLGVNRIRVALAGRTRDGKRWNEPLVLRTEKFAFKMEPWLAARPDNLEDPGYDVTRFNLDFYRKTERLLRRCRERDIVVSLIFYVGYLSKPGPASLQLARGMYRARWYNPRAGSWHELPNLTQAADGNWTSPKTPDTGDWALLTEAKT